MHTKFLNIFPFVIILLITAFGCSDMESNYSQYLQGEKVYAGKLDSLEVFSGYKRVKITGMTRFLGNSKECIVEWEDQSRTFTIDKLGKERFEMIIDNLQERSYEFKVYTKDINGNKSVLQIARGRSVGDIFKSTQQTRRIIGVTVEDGDAVVNWADKAESEYVIFTELSYDNNKNEVTKVVISPDDLTTSLINWKPLGKMERISAIRSGVMGFDTIYLEKVESELPAPPFDQLNKNLFSLVRMSDDNPGTSYGADPVKYLFDGDGSWSGNDAFGYHSGENAIPHHFTIDLGVTAQIRKCRLDLRDPKNFAGNNPTEVELWGIMDITNAETSESTATEFEAKGWKLLYRGSVDGANSQSVEFDVATGPDVRYLRYRVTRTVGGKGAQLTEMTFWGQNIQPLALSKSLFKLVGMPDDNPGTSYGANPSKYLFDGDGSWSGSDAYGYHSGENAVPHHFTIDLGVVAQIQKCRLDLRDPKNFAGNNPTLVELWGIMDITNAETSASTATEFEAKGWKLLFRGPVDGANKQSVEFNVEAGPNIRYLRYRVVETVGGKGAQLTEMTFYGQVE